MSKFCPFCDDVKDSEINSGSDLKEHIVENHESEMVNYGLGEADEAIPSNKFNKHFE